MTREEAIEVTRQRRDWLTARIAAKRSVGWDVAWDERERAAHSRILAELGQERNAA
jgi:hypothetical protein